jgi:hypothetical protein
MNRVITTDCPPPDATNVPCVFVGDKDGPKEFPTAPDFFEVTRLPLPAGKYMIFATLTVFNSSPTPINGSCKLVAGNSFDRVLFSVDRPTGGTLGHTPVALSTAVEFTTEDAAILQCLQGSAATTQPVPGTGAVFIKMTAIRVGTLIPVNLP